MDVLEIVFLAIVQGITEFLPISSSAHLILPSQLLGWQDQGLAFDVAVHLGTLLAIVIYFRSEVIAITRDWFAAVLQGKSSANAILGWSIIIATIPAVIVGFFINSYMDDLRSILVIACTTLVFGLLLGYADRRGHSNTLETVGYKQAVIIGLMQCLALIPGTSRSGITMTAALMLGLSREASARFSFLISIPLILAASILKSKDLVEATSAVDWSAMGLGVLLSFVSAYACIHWFLKIINSMGFAPFVIYRVILSAVLFAIYFQVF